MDILWVGMAFVFGMLVSRIKLPPLVGYLAAGALLSVYGYEPGNALHEVAHLGVLFLLFTVGLHLRLKNIIRIEVLGTGGIHLAITTGIFLPIAMSFGYSLLSALIIAVVLGFSSTVLTAKNLERRGELGAFHGRVA
ncbi:MAG: cation:proton antiporter, partial [Balneolaceae bacterium]|nr:cation:proton antiporter [Balneolaceae bacterium]